jgi:hypothetical protein
MAQKSKWTALALIGCLCAAATNHVGVALGQSPPSESVLDQAIAAEASKDRSGKTRSAFRVQVAKTSAYQLVYTCDGQYGKWFLLLNSWPDERPPLPLAEIAFRGPSTYNTFKLKRRHVSGVKVLFVLPDPGPIREYHEPITEAHAFVPIRGTRFSIDVKGAAGTKTFASFERFSDKSLGEFGLCRGRSFPRALHPAPLGEGRPLPPL